MSDLVGLDQVFQASDFGSSDFAVGALDPPPCGSTGWPVAAAVGRHAWTAADRAGP